MAGMIDIHMVQEMKATLAKVEKYAFVNRELGYVFTAQINEGKISWNCVKEGMTLAAGECRLGTPNQEILNEIHDQYETKLRSLMGTNESLD